MGGGAHECNLTGRCIFFKDLDNPFRKIPHFTSLFTNDMPDPSHHQTNKSQFADNARQWALSKNIDLAAEYLQRDLDKLASWCAKWRIKLNSEKTKVIIFS